MPTPHPVRVRPAGLPFGPVEVARRLRRAPGFFFLDSALETPGEGRVDIPGEGRVDIPGEGRFSYLGAFPESEIVCEAGEDGSRKLAELDALLADRRSEPVPAPLGWAGGAVGFFAYDFCRSLERVPPRRRGEGETPLFRFAFYPAILAFEHATGTWFAAGSGPQGAVRAAADRLLEAARGPEVPAAPARIGPWTPEISRAQYLESVEGILERIRAGEIYQANFAQRFTASFAGDSWAAYERFRSAHPCPYGAYLSYSGFDVLCFSPELLLEKRGLRIRTSPIKGTRPRVPADPGADRRMRDELLASPKDDAELTMIVDLERNDLGRICRAGSVRVAARKRLESYSAVHHLVADVEGVLEEGASLERIMRAVFPGGSITGCPKIRAMRVLSELEPSARGVYTGSVGYLGADGSLGLNIAIRTLVRRPAEVELWAGGGIVADSDPDLEYVETLHKGRIFLTAVGGGLQ